MSMIITRKKFREYWNSISPGLGDTDSGLWALEHYEQVSPRWFVNVQPLKLKKEADRIEYWNWIRNHCRGRILCYCSSPDAGEWWGFTHYADIFVWIIRWS